MKKIYAIVAICVAVVAASVAGIVISSNRAAADKAASEEMVASKEAKKAEAEKATAAFNAKTTEAKAAAEKSKLEAAEAENEKLRLEAENLAAKKAIAAEERAKADAEERKAAELKAAKDIELKAAKEAADGERAKAQAAADDLARTEATKAIREAETLKLKVSMAELAAEKLRYEELNAELVEYQKELDERERMLRPEKTIADVSWIPGDDLDVDENGRPRPKKKPPYLAENDPELPKGTRVLAKAQRERETTDDLLSQTLRSQNVSRLEALYVAALKEGRMVDAGYYRVALKSMYPDWEYKAPVTTEKQAPSTPQP